MSLRSRHIRQWRKGEKINEWSFDVGDFGTNEKKAQKEYQMMCKNDQMVKIIKAYQGSNSAKGERLREFAKLCTKLRMTKKRLQILAKLTPKIRLPPRPYCRPYAWSNGHDFVSKTLSLILALCLHIFPYFLDSLP